MVFWLEVGGELKRCRVEYPYSQNLHHWGMVRNSNKRDSYVWDLCTKQIKFTAAQAVEAGAYEVLP